MSDVRLELCKERGYGIITLDIGATRNAMGAGTVPELIEALTVCNANQDIRCVIITGASDKAFSSGGDLNTELKYSNEPQNLESFTKTGGDFLKLIMSCRIPVITAVNGVAFGAAIGIIVVSDFAIAVEKAVFGFPTTSLGGIPGWGCTQLLPRAIGLRNAKRLMIANERFDAQEALRLGLIDSVVKQEELMPKAIELAERLAFYAPEAVSTMKKIMNSGIDGSLNESFALEELAFCHVNQQPNFQEGICAFLEKRRPVFRYRN